MTRFLLLGSLLLVGGAGAQVKETPATLGLLEGGNPRGFVQGSNDQGILFATASGSRGQLVPYTKIRGEGLDKLIRFDERTEALSEARVMFGEGRYDEAGEAFGVVARNYAIIISAPQNFASEALFYQLECLRRAGKFAQLGQLMEAPVVVTVETKLSDFYQKSFEYQKLWALLGQKDIEGLRTALAAYQQPVLGDAKLLPTANFNVLPPAELAQLGYLRAKVFEADGETEKAGSDFYRAFTLAYGNDPMVSKLAMGASMQIQIQNPLIASDDKAAISELQSVAYLFSKRFGDETMPAELKAFAIRPSVPVPVIAPDAEIEAAPAEPEEAPVEAEEEKGKGKGKEKAK